MLELLSNGVEIDDKTSRELLAEAMRMSAPSSELVQLLIKERRRLSTEVMVKEELTTLLANSVVRSNQKIAQLLIQSGADVNNRSIYDGTRTPLYHAAYSGDTEMLKILLEAKPDMGTCVDGDDTCLPIHAGSDNVEILKLLISAGAEVDVVLSSRVSPLYLASTWGSKECVEEILRGKLKLDYKVRETTILRAAADNNHEAIACMLLEAGLNPCHPETKAANSTTLYACVKKQQFELLRKLLIFDMDLEYRDEVGRTVMNCLATAEDEPALRLLITRGAKVDSQDDGGFSPLGKAIFNDEVELARFLIGQGASINKPFDSGSTPLLLACEKGSLKMVKMLIDEGADFKYVDQGLQGTIFQAACLNQTYAQSEILNYLLDNKLVDVHQTSSVWGANLSTACLTAEISIMKRLIGLGADINAEDMVGRRPIHFALYRTLDHVKCLLDGENKAELFGTDIMQRNPLHFAVVSGRVDVIEYILDQQSNFINEKDCDE